MFGFYYVQLVDKLHDTDTIFKTTGVQSNYTSFNVGIEDVKPSARWYPMHSIFVAEWKQLVLYASVRGGMCELELELVSGSTLLDLKRESRSYQDGALTYRQIMKETVREVEGGAIFTDRGGNHESALDPLLGNLLGIFIQAGQP